MHLVIRGSEVETRTLKELARLTGASGIEQVEPNVFRLKNAAPAPGIEELCAAQKLSWRFMPDNQPD